MVEQTLNNVHKHLCRAVHLTIVMIIKRKLWRSNVEEIHNHLSEAQRYLGEFDEWPNKSGL